jgi:CheY-like chemotaxis protein
MSVILIVEDEEQVRVLAESVLRDAGYEVLAATALEGAQALLNSDQLIDLLFVDVNLGGDLEAGFG